MDRRILTMTADLIPATTSIKYLRARNVDTDRLRRRRAYLLANKGYIAGEADARIVLRARARELHAVEDALVERGKLAVEATVLGRRARFVPVDRRRAGAET
jgi:hypothetical protein